MKNAVAIIANLWCWAVLILISLLALIFSPLWLIIFRVKGWSQARAAREGIWLYGRLYMASIKPFVKMDMRNPYLVVNNFPAIIVLNHQSWLDIYLLSAQKTRNLCILVRTWPFKRLFFFGPMMRLANYIETEGVSAEEILCQCRLELQAGATIVCYPEGTRSRDGSIGRFRSGVFKLAVALDAPIIPLIIHNSGQLMPKGSLIFRPGTIKMEIGPVLRPDAFKGASIAHGAFRRFVREHFQQALQNSDIKSAQK